MAFPAVEQVVENSTNTAGANHTINLPTATANQLLLIILDKGSTAATVNAHASLTELLDENSGNGLYIAYRWMDGNEPASYTLVTSANTRTASMAYRISGAINPAAVPPQIGSTGTGTSATPDPPASAAPPSTKDYLFIALAGMAGEEADDDTWGNTPPTNYTPSPPRQKSCGTAGTNLGGLILAAERQLNTGAAENPGTFGVDASAAWRSQTITVHPPVNTTVTPGVLALTTVTFAPTVTTTQNQRVAPSTATLATSAFAPTVATPRLATPSVVSLTTATFAPTVATPRLATPDTADLALATFAPSVVAPQLVTPEVAELVTDTFAPTIALPVLATPPTVDLALSAFAPDVNIEQGGVTVTPSTASLATDTFAPTVMAPRRVVPPTLSLATERFAPDVEAQADWVFTPSTRALAMTAFAPYVGSVQAEELIAGGVEPPEVRPPNPQRIVPRTRRLGTFMHPPQVTIGDDTTILALFLEAP